MRDSRSFKLSDPALFKRNLLEWSSGYNYVVWLDSNKHSGANPKFDAVLAVGAQAHLSCQAGSGFSQLKSFIDSQKDWMFGYLGYDLKNEIETLESNNRDSLGFADLQFFIPKKMVFIKGQSCEFSYRLELSEQIESDYDQISSLKKVRPSGKTINSGAIRIKLRTSKDTYFERFEQIHKHLQRGDIYETNYCQEFYAEQTEIDPWAVFEQLNALGQAPFSTFSRFENHFVLSSSPERYLQKQGTQILSQPIKGTAKRGSTLKEDAAIMRRLQDDPKERSENIMITDLVRNDLSHLALAGTVKVEKLCELQSFKQVHQLVTSVTAEVPPEVHAVDLIRATFPMGSMTGAPKVAAMTIAESVEDFKRGVYSGALGYFKPNGDFDFNVVIRSILYNKQESYVSFAVGGAITAAARAGDEYEECLLKAKAMRTVLESNS